MYDMITLEVGGSEMPAMITRPTGDGPHPGLQIAMHLPGHIGLEKDKFTIDLAERFAANGYVTVTPFVFHRQPDGLDAPARRDLMNDTELLADMDAGYQWLTGQDGVDAARLGIIGHCFGGRQTWLAVAHNQNYQAMATMWGGRIDTGWGAGNPAPLDLTGDIKCPVLGIFGNDDQGPSPDDVNAYEAALKEAGVEYSFHRYDGAGHAFQDFAREDRYRKAQSDDAWEKQLAFFADKLG